MKEKISITINRSLLKNIDSVIDNIYIRNRSQAIEYLIKKVVGENKTAVILAGGDEEKSRISATEYRPTARLSSETVLGLALKTLRKNNFREVYLVARHKILTKAFELFGDGNRYGVKLNYVEEKESSGTFDTLKLLKGRISTNFLVVYGDLIFDKISLSEIWDDHLRSHAMATIMLTTSSKPSEKGNVIVEGNRILDFIQKPRESENYIVFSPLFVAEPELLEHQGTSLEQNIFPQLARNGLLNGYISSVKEHHIHSKADVEKFLKKGKEAPC